MSASNSGFRPLARRQRRQQRRGGGFTLVELLVVIGVLVLIISILVPVVGRARAQAARTSCANTLRNLGHAVMAFAGEHNGNLPTCGNDVPHTPTTGTYWILWGGSGNGIDATNSTDYMNESGLAKYLGFGTPDKGGQPNNKLRSYYRCPSVVEEQRANDDYKYDYVFNAQLSGLPLDRVENASQKGMIVEQGHQADSKSVDSAYRWWLPQTLALRHGGNGANCLYGDGHVDIMDPKYNADFTVWDAYYTPASSSSPNPTESQPQNVPDPTNGYGPAK